MSIGGNLPVLRQWVYMYHINDIAKPWPVYIGVTQVNCIISVVQEESTVGGNKVGRDAVRYSGGCTVKHPTS